MGPDLLEKDPCPLTETLGRRASQPLFLLRVLAVDYLELKRKVLNLTLRC